MAEKGKSTLDLNTPSEQVARKRGRPRKPDAAGNSVLPQGRAVESPVVRSAVSLPPLMGAVSSVSSVPMTCPAVSPPVSQVVSGTPPAHTLSHLALNSANRTRGRGRSRGSRNLQMLASRSEFYADTAAADFRGHVIHVDSGEDVIRKIMSLVENSPLGICVISASGNVSNPTIRHPGPSGDVIIYEGQFQILSLNGIFTVSETGMGRCRTGGFSVSLACPDGRVIGGGVACSLVAASGVQTVVGSFIPNAYRNYGRQQQAARPEHVGG